MTDELKPCPFCGSDDIETFYNRSGVDHYTCQYCGATAKQWNTRHESGELPEWLRKAIMELKLELPMGIINHPHSYRETIRCCEMTIEAILSLKKPEEDKQE